MFISYIHSVVMGQIGHFVTLERAMALNAPPPPGSASARSKACILCYTG